MRYLQYVFVLVLCATDCMSQTVNATTPEESAYLIWLAADFIFPCSSTRNIYSSTDRFIRKNIINTRVQIWNDKVIGVFPRYKEGVPVTLAQTALLENKCIPTWEAFPNWAAQEEGECTAIQNAVDLYVDTQNRLWVLDSGIVNTLAQPVRRCAPKIMVYNLNTSELIRLIDLSALTNAGSRVQYLAVDEVVSGPTYAYVTDAGSRSIIVWDTAECRGWRIVLPQAVMAGCHQLDVLYLALIKHECGTSALYITYLSSSRIFSIETEYLRSGSDQGKIVDHGQKPAKMVLLGEDGGSKIFFRYEGKSPVFSWDTENPFKIENFIRVYRGQNCRLSTHVVPDYKRERMAVLESNFQDFIQGTVGCGTSHTLGPLIYTVVDTC